MKFVSRVVVEENDAMGSEIERARLLSTQSLKQLILYEVKYLIVVLLKGHGNRRRVDKNELAIKQKHTA